MAYGKMTREQFERREVFAKKGLKHKLRPTGYEAYRVSPRTTTLYGVKYKKLFGAVVTPDYSRKVGSKFGAEVKWYPHGFTRASTKSGTVLLGNISDYPVERKETALKLMLRSKKQR